jgi:uncharacterized protein
LINYFKKELIDLKNSVKTLSFKETFIFLSIAIISFISIYYSSPNFFRKIFDTEDDKFYSTIYWFSADGFLMFVVPLLIIIFIFKGKVKNYGFQLGDTKFGIRSTFVFLLFMIPVLWIVSGSESFAKTYPQGGIRIKENLPILLYYELFVGFYMLAWEFFWRGYVLFGLKEKFGFYAIFIQMIPFFILHKGKPEIETFASIFAGLILGIQALRANSFLYCFLAHWSVMIFIDLISVLRYKSHEYGIGFDAVYNIFLK